MMTEGMSFSGPSPACPNHAVFGIVSAFGSDDPAHVTGAECPVDNPGGNPRDDPTHTPIKL